MHLIRSKDTHFVELYVLLSRSLGHPLKMTEIFYISKVEHKQMSTYDK